MPNEPAKSRRDQSKSQRKNASEEITAVFEQAASGAQ